MKSQQLLTALLVFLAAVVIAIFVVTVIRDEGDQDPPTDGHTVGSTEKPYPGIPSTPRAQPPTTDLFGNRLEVPTSPAGDVLARHPGPDLDPNNPDYLTAPPAGLQWQRAWGGAALPVSTSDGPARIDDGVASGFARTPRGAALAALDAFGRALAAPEGTWQRVVDSRYYGDTARLLDRFARSRASSSDPGRYVTVPDGVRIQPGYRDDFAVVQIAARSANGYATVTWPVAWVDNDWRIRIPGDIESFWRPGVSSSSLNGFGNWKWQP
ncbi:hypothetical protein [Nocardia carnea]|uniref:hypothetical protein n=1 Tax=Nocardia carnea TaxID=37328 RepID=UPI0024546C71|nr:hypothetical protein [Nocardia carnea]